MTAADPTTPTMDQTWRRTTLAAVKSYRRRRRYLQRGGELFEIASIIPWAKCLRVTLKGQPDACYVLAPEHTAWVRQGPCRRERRAS